MIIIDSFNLLFSEEYEIKTFPKKNSNLRNSLKMRNP